MYYSYLTTVFPAVTVLCLLLFFRYYRAVSLPLAGTTEWITRIVSRPRFTLTFRVHKMDRRDVAPLALLTLASAALGFFRLGDTAAPQSFFQFTEEKPSVVIELKSPVEIGSVMYYTGLWTGYYTLEFSGDGVNWQVQYPAAGKQHSMDQPHSDLFKWLYATINDDNGPTRYIRIAAEKTPIELGEVALFAKDGKRVPAEALSSSAPELFDEQEIVPAAPSYLNSMYFDEIYHGRTAYEYVRGVTPYETTHPPLGKLIISIGVRLFGMTPFGWRFMGALFGVLMVPVMYVFIKNMFGKTPVAAAGTALFAFDFMRYTQTRIATIDTYGVFFILLSYLFMYRFLVSSPEARFRKKLLPLSLSGVFFGVGCACKWTVVYAGAGLFFLFVLHLAWCYRHYRDNELPGYSRLLLRTLLSAFVFYLLVPAMIYCASYIPNAAIAGMSLRGGMLWDGRFYKLVWDSQAFMYSYHSHLKATHSYSSTWWQWLLDARPILYYRDTSMGGGLKSSFAAFGNPVVWWGGLLAIFAMAYRLVSFRDGKALFILAGYLSQLLPWLFVTRVVFIYHYFPSVVFLVLALSHVFDTIWERAQGRYKLAVGGFAGASALLFAAFFPVISGVTVPELYTKYFLRWIPPSWPF